MALILDNISLDSNIRNLSYVFKQGFITAVDGENASLLVDILMKRVNFQGVIKNDSDVNDNIIYIKNNDFLYTARVKDEFNFINNVYNIDNKEYSNRVDKYLSLFGFDSSFLNRLTNTLSKTETYLVNIIKGLISDYSVIIFDKVFYPFDYKYTKILKQLINNLKVTGKVVILLDDINIMYTLANDILILNSNGTNYSGEIKSVCTDVELLQSFSVNPPLLSLVTYKAKSRKNINISYHKDVRDLIKDVYKHV